MCIRDSIETLQPRNRLEKLSLPASRNTRDTENFSRTRRKGYIVQNFYAVVIDTIQMRNGKSVADVFRFRPFYIPVSYTHLAAYLPPYYTRGRRGKRGRKWRPAHRPPR